MQMAREWCGCGAAFYTLSPRALKAWRTTHHHDPKTDPEPDKQGAIAMTDHAGTRYYEDAAQDVPVVQARIGFTPNA